jgi:diguanylate cyclase (GGDEF)-like protein/PAS domain S-box-containing protein
MAAYTDPAPDVEAETQRQKTALLYRSAGIAQLVTVVNASLLAYVNASLQALPRAAFAWWCLVVAIAAARYLLARRYQAARPDATAATVWRRRYVGVTAMSAVTWGAGASLFMWNAPDGARLFSGLVLCGMVAGAVPLLAPVPAAFRTFAVLVAVPMSAVILLQADSALHWSFGAMGFIFLAAMLASARYLHEMLDVAIRLGLEEGRLVADLGRAASAAEAALAERTRMEEDMRRERDFAESLIDTALAIVLVLDTEGRVVRFNRFFEELSGHLLEEVRGASWLDAFVPGRDREAARGLLQDAIGGGRMPSGIHAIVAKDGREILVEWSSRILKDASGSVAGVLAIGQDVTRREELAASQRLLTAAMEQSSSSIMVTDLAGRITFVNAAFCRTTGYSPGEVIGRNPRILKSGQTPPEVHRDLWTSLIDGRAWRGVLRNRKKNGELYWEDASISPVVDAKGHTSHYLAVKDDITLRKQAEAEVARLSEWNELLLNSAGEGIYGVDREGNCSFINPAALAMLGFEREAVLGKNPHLLFHGHARDGSPYPMADCPIALTQRDGVLRKAEDTFVRASGGSFPVQLSVTPILESGRLVGVEVVFQDIAGRKAMEAELARLATTDPLTGVANRRRFLEQVGMELDRMKRFGDPATLLMLDVDHFKAVNDTHGHAAGDAVLRHLAELARLRLRRVDLLGRLGGEEFGILLPGTNRAGALLLAERFRRQVEDTPAQSAKGSISVTISIGVTELGPGDSGPDAILARADAALYRAKEAGRNRVEAG